MEILEQVERKLKNQGKLYIVDMDPLLFAEHYAVPYSYTEVEEILESGGWACNHEIIPHRFVTLYIVIAEKLSYSDYNIEELWRIKKERALRVYQTARKDSISDYQKMMQAMTSVCSIDAFFSGIWK